jgi:GT2 family glycosyltransferase
MLNNDGASNISPIVSIIIVNWNGLPLLQECLDAVLRQSYSHYEIVLVDNASQDDSVRFVQGRYPQVKILPLLENTGFTGGNIAGLQEASGELIVLLNNDAVLTERWLELMVDALRSDASIGFCSSKIIVAGTDRIDSVGDTFTSAFTGTKMGEHEPESLFKTRRLVPGACAAAVIYRREMLDRIGFFDEDFFFNHEDTDLNLRAWLSGWKCLFVPEAVVFHKVNASVGELSDMGVYYFARNNVWVWIKNVPLGIMLRYLPQRLIYEFSSFAFFCLVKKKWKPFLKGKRDAFKRIPLMLKKRKEVQKLVLLSNHEIVTNLMPISVYLKTRLKNKR